MGVGTELAKAYVQIIPSFDGLTEHLQEGIDPGAKKAGKDAGDTIGKKIGKFAVKAIAALGIGTMISKAITDGMDFESSMAKASTLFSGTSEELADLQSQILSISNSTGVAASELAEAAYSAESASVPMGNLGAMIESSSKLATAGFTDIDTALSATAKTMNAYGMMSDDVAKTQANMEKVQKVLIQTQNKGITTVDELGASLAQVTPTAAAMGVNFEQVGAALAVMTAQGTPTAQATTQLRSAFAELGKSGTTAANSLAEATKGTEYAGKSFSQLMEEGVDLGTVMSLLQNHADATGVKMVDLFSSIEGGNAAMAIAKDVQAFTDDLSAMATESDVVGEAYGTMSDTVSFKMEQVKTTLTNMGIESFNSVADTLLGILTSVTEVISEIKPLLDALMPLVNDIISSAMPILLDLIRAIMPFVINLAQLLLPVISSLLKALSPILTPIFEAIKKISDALSRFLTPIIEAVTIGINGIKTAIETVVNFFKGIKFEWPKIKMPHFGITPKGWKIGDLLKGSIPKLGIDWYDKGGVFASPTVIGVGEKRPEFVGALDDLRDIVRQESARAITTTNNTQTINQTFNMSIYGAEGQDVKELAEIVMDRIQSAVDRRSVVWA